MIHHLARYRLIMAGWVCDHVSHVELELGGPTLWGELHELIQASRYHSLNQHLCPTFAGDNHSNINRTFRFKRYNQPVALLAPVSFCLSRPSLVLSLVSVHLFHLALDSTPLFITDCCQYFRKQILSYQTYSDLFSRSEPRHLIDLSSHPAMVR